MAKGSRVYNFHPLHSGVRVARPQAIGHARAILSEACAWLPTIMLGPLPVLDDTAADERVADLSAELGAICAALRVPFLDTFSFAARSAIWRASAASGDGTHPDAAGYAALAAMVTQWPPWRALIDARR